MIPRERNYSEPEKYVRCKQCGFMCKTDRDRHSQDGAKDGAGITSTAQVGVTTIYDPIVTGGCPKCGTLMY